MDPDLVERELSANMMSQQDLRPRRGNAPHIGFIQNFQSALGVKSETLKESAQVLIEGKGVVFIIDAFCISIRGRF